jgi:hypothetical protein
MITVACVRVGRRYSPDYVDRLHRAVERHSGGRPLRFVCLTDQPDRYGRGVERIDIAGCSLPGWWAKMTLFRRDVRDLWAGERVVYFDLDTVVCGALDPLLSMTFEAEDQHQFAICENFTRRAGNTAWPCRYGSCVMVFGERYGNGVWTAFRDNAEHLMAKHEAYGDQRVIEMFEPSARLLQDWLPPGFMISYRDIQIPRNNGVSIINFGGRHKPDNCEVGWVTEEWQ